MLVVTAFVMSGRTNGFFFFFLHLKNVINGTLNYFLCMHKILQWILEKFLIYTCQDL